MHQLVSTYLEGIVQELGFAAWDQAPKLHYSKTLLSGQQHWSSHELSWGLQEGGVCRGLEAGAEHQICL